MSTTTSHYLKEVINTLKSSNAVIVALLTSVLVLIEYTFSLESQINSKLFGTILHPIAQFLYYGFVYYGTVSLTNEKTVWNSKPFWLISTLALISMSPNATMYVPIKCIKFLTYPEAARTFLDSCVINISYTFHFLILLPVFYFVLRRDKPRIGMGLKGFHWKPYLWMMFAMLPFILISSLTSDFAEYYPNCKLGASSEVLQLPSWVLTIVYLVTYRLNFLGTEVVVRGVLVVLMSKYLGKRAILPMVTLYTVWHFGKPLVGTISSFFGGYILGYMAYKQKNILGGVLLHIGVAFSMELFAYLL